MNSTTTNSTYYFLSINVPYSQCEALYSPSVPNVVLVADNGVKVQVPTSRLRQFITSQGVKGRFRMTVNAQLKIVAFERVR